MTKEFTDAERNAIRVLIEILAEKLGTEDAVDVIVMTKAAAALGVKTKSETGAYRMIRNDEEIHNFLRKVYDPIEDSHPEGESQK